MPNIEILPADLSNPAHQLAIVELIDAYARDPLINGQPLSPEVRRELVPGLAHQPGSVTVLARCDHRYVGIAVCFPGFSTFAARPLLNIHDLAVLAEYRGRGIGRRLIEAVETKARELGCCKVTLEVLESNHVARGLYKSTGFSSGDSSHTGGDFLFLTKRL